MNKPEPAAPARILLVDDHPIVRHGISALLAREKAFTICGEASTFEEADAALAQLRPDLLILDITLKDRNGLQLIPIARAHDPDIKVLALSMHDEEDYAEKALRAGAQGYVMKENADEVLVEALHTVLGGEVFVSPETSARMLRHFVAGTDAAERPKQGVESLTERELEIFACIGKGMTTRKIAEQFELSDRTVEVHRAHIKKKMQCEDSAQLLREAVRWVEAERHG